MDCQEQLESAQVFDFSLFFQFFEPAAIRLGGGVSDRLAKLLGRLQIDGNQLRDTALGHGDAEQPIHAGHGDRIVGDDDEARLGAYISIVR
jgi:hypothetical protein